MRKVAVVVTGILAVVVLIVVLYLEPDGPVELGSLPIEDAELDKQLESRGDWVEGTLGPPAEGTPVVKEGDPPEEPNFERTIYLGEGNCWREGHRHQDFIDCPGFKIVWDDPRMQPIP